MTIYARYTSKAPSLVPCMLAVVLASSGCTPATLAKRDHNDPVVHPPEGPVSFDRDCANEIPYRVRAYALLGSSDGSARALAAATAGYHPGTGGTVRIGLELQALDLAMGAEWSNSAYTMRIRASSGDRVAQSEQVDTYQASNPGEPPRARRFTTDAEGRGTWITFVEPGERTEDTDRTYRIPPELDVSARDLGVRGPGEAVALSLIATHAETKESIELAGPSIRIPPRVWEMKPPAAKVLGLVATLDPHEEGGLWSTLGRGWKYRECIEERRAAKRRFERWSASRRDSGA